MKRNTKKKKHQQKIVEKIWNENHFENDYMCMLYSHTIIDEKGLLMLIDCNERLQMKNKTCYKDVFGLLSHADDDDRLCAHFFDHTFLSSVIYQFDKLLNRHITSIRNPNI